MAILLVGVTLMLVSGISPLDEAPTLDPATLLEALRGLRPEAFLLLGIGLVIATPILRVAAAAVTYARSGEVRMLGISIGILVVITIGVVAALASPER